METTIRQRLIDALIGTRLSTRQLAERLMVPERQIEDHLTHVVRTLAKDPARRFLMEPAFCQDCAFTFRGRTKLTCPSRCPRCRSEYIAVPRFGIDCSASSR